MTGTDVAVVITSLSTLVGVLGGILVQLRGQNEAKTERAALSSKMEQVKVATDGLTDKLSDAKLAQGTAEGTAAGLAAGLAAGRAEK
jgi:hypothetical protein